jgi:negative regulator of genetic competence, sporulation and motility
MAIDPEQLQTQSAPNPSGANESQDNEQEAQESTDKGPLESIRIDPAEEGGHIVTHEPKASKRVKNADFESMRPRKHVVKNHEELMKHLEKHTKRLSA